MKAGKAPGPALDRPDASTRFYLFHGADDASSRALGERLLTGLGAGKHELAAAALKADPSLLAGEAGALSLFGERRALWIDPAGDDIVPAVEALLATPAVDSPVIALAGALKKSSGLLNLAEAHASAFCLQSYLPEGRSADRLVGELGRNVGLTMTADVAGRIAADAMNNRAVIAAELEKFALYLGASPESPRSLDDEAIDRLGSDTSEGDASRLGDLALSGQLAELTESLQRFAPGAELGLLRSIQRRLLQLAPMRARIETGESLASVMASPGKPLFWKDKDMVQQLLARWNARRLAQLGERVSRLEVRLMTTTVPDHAAVGEELITIARAARR